MSFWELVLCGVVALIVLGPERLPGAIRSTSKFINGIRQFGQQMKAELGDELRAHELHQKLKDAEEKGLLNLTAAEISALAELRQAASDVTQPYAPSSATTTEPPPTVSAPAVETTALTGSTAKPDEHNQDKPGVA
ncbi:MAG: Sec-independent protein translocase protein TatB [Gammaproteobacteria bacterium]|jgi:sec-independent protein translocase protein TatB|nr:Sec-independent protein translocase protein TatB [Gammaproteobacteria bacterium]MBU2178951.1 Sec-independent protein translocase protein TatB [Gammaproteobacteria bacterium]MBU2225334.1 Sec-independent protein translocase protein TatB [Gammaproteobacteria bacterium]MBU2279175.1 Sec-independent protein translocase protein TatB [Gammaproteobacteria bacterium]MBU2427653.1 Sec-independent protein translocase protein TatB [Gammaproteobacteria bacterium]